MKTRILKIDPALDPPGLVEMVAGVLLENGVIAYPTETFYGLGAAAFSQKAVKRVFRLKKRDPGKPLGVIASDMDMVRRLTIELPPAFWVLAEEFWPGPLTLVLRASPELPDFLAGPGGSIGIRIPSVPWLRHLVAELNQPLTATSANLSGEKDLADPPAVTAVFIGKIDLIVDGGPSPGGAPSTVVDLLGDELRLLREGLIPADRIRAALQQ